MIAYVEMRNPAPQSGDPSAVPAPRCCARKVDDLFKDQEVRQASKACGQGGLSIRPARLRSPGRTEGGPVRGGLVDRRLQGLVELEQAERFEQVRRRSEESRFRCRIVNARAHDWKLGSLLPQPFGNLEALRLGRFHQQHVRASGLSEVDGERRLVAHAADDCSVESPQVSVPLSYQNNCHVHVLVHGCLISEPGQV